MPTRPWHRRAFLRTAGGLGALAVLVAATEGARRALAPRLAEAREGEALADLLREAPRARYWIAGTSSDCAACHDPGTVDAADPPRHARPPVRCRLCARDCLIPAGERGMCRARMNVDGELRSLVYGRPISIHVDPIEKKPFYHFLPGTEAFSLATSGCPLRCRFCQNWEISQAAPEDYGARRIPPGGIAAEAASRGAPVIAFTYNEPTVFAEYLLDIAAAARERGIRTALVSCGFMNEEPLADLCAALDAIKIDLKGFAERFYADVCSASLAPVLRSLRGIAKRGPHLEIVNLVVPTLNDDPAMLRELVAWIAGELGPDVPVHFTRFHPDYQLPHLPPTPVASLERARELALAAGLRYAYVGNVPGHPGNHTYCPGCGAIVVERRGFFTVRIALRGGACAACGTPIAGIWS